MNEWMNEFVEILLHLKVWYDSFMTLGNNSYTNLS